jgi:predicted ArsR family transcriptional regulator
MKFIISLLGLTRLDHQRNTIRGKLKVEKVADEIQIYQKNLLQHVKRMEHSRILTMALVYQPKGKGEVGRPKTRWRDQQEHLKN